MKLFKSQFGFSLVEVMVASGITAGIALFLTQLQQNSAKVSITADVDSEIIQATNQIQTILYNQNSCIATITENNVNATPFPAAKLRGTLTNADYRPVAMIYAVKETATPINPAATPWAFAPSDIKTTNYRLKTGPLGGFVVPGKLSIASMGVAIVQDVAGGEEFAELLVDFQKENKMAYGSRDASGVITKRKLIKLQLQMTGPTPGPARRFLTCFSNIGNAINTAVERSCNGNNAFLHIDPVTGDKTCFHEVVLPTSCAPGEVIRAVRQETILDATSAAPADNTKAVGFECVALEASCPAVAGHTAVVTRIVRGTTNAAPITVQCAQVPHCSAVQTLNMDSAGNFQCIDRSCANGIGVVHNNNWRCIPCGQGQMIVMKPSGPVCESVLCGNTGISGANTANQGATTQQYFVGFDANGDKVCRDLLTGNPGSCKFGSSLKLNSSDGSIQQECCPDCDAGEKSTQCEGSIFYSSNGCSVCRGTKSLTTGCPQAGSFCSNGCPVMGVCVGSSYNNPPMSQCNTACPGGWGKEEGAISAWSAWSGCSNPSTLTETRTRSCIGNTCGGTCAGQPTSETQACLLEGGRERADCFSSGGYVVGVNNSSGNYVYICRMGSTSCPASWTQYQNFTQTYANCVAIHGSGNGYCSPTWCPGTYTRDGTTRCSGSHSFSNTSTIESGGGERQRKGGSPGCACHDDGWTSVWATRNAVGCN